ncbi:MAG: fumarylacetoacetate hydrolase family protein [Bdellovibrionota bacterium]
MKNIALGTNRFGNVAPTEEALSFSLIEKNNNQQIILVLSINDSTVEHINLSESLKLNSHNPFHLFKNKSYETLLSEINALKINTTSIDYSDLIQPLKLNNQHLCAGLNYRDHIEESGQKSEYVLFPKYGECFSHNLEIPVENNTTLPELLDYEIELGLVFDHDIRTAKDVEGAHVGFLICNDLSDRAPQVYFHTGNKKHLSYSFTAAKSKTEYSLVAPILVIPRDWKSFSSNLEMSLFLNGELKQKSNTNKMTQTITDMLQTALEFNSQSEWPLLGETPLELSKNKKLKLLPQDQDSKFYLPANTLFMTGTPGGTLFQKPTQLELFLALIKIPFLKIDTSNLSFKEKLKLSLIHNWSNSGKYLKASDQINSHIEKLGCLNFKVTKI